MPLRATKSTLWAVPTGHTLEMERIRMLQQWILGQDIDVEALVVFILLLRFWHTPIHARGRIQS